VSDRDNRVIENFYFSQIADIMRHYHVVQWFLDIDVVLEDDGENFEEL
jgi:hypothetical protein